MILRTLAATLAVALIPSANAQSYPDRTIRMIVPFASGGVTDVVSRPLAQRLSMLWGHQVIVENRPGAGSTIGAAEIARARPDGYNLLLSGSTHLVAAGLYRKLPYDPINDFTPIVHIGEQPSAVIVHPSLPVKTLAELIAYARANPKKLNYASSGNGSSQHLMGALLFNMTNVELVHVPYKGSGPALTDLLSGLVPVSVPSISNVVSHVQGGKLRALATTGAKRSPAMPDVPTIDEAGVKGYEATLWFGMFGPKGLPPEIVAKVQDGIAEALRTPDLLKAYATQGVEVRFMTTPQFAPYFRSEGARWAKIVRDSGATVD